jgi:hypothetical protein
MQSGKDTDFSLTSIPHFLEEAKMLVNSIKGLTVSELMERMHISREIAELNYIRYQNWQPSKALSDDIQPCSFLFNGEVYKALEVRSWSKSDLLRAQERLLILSGLYGVLKPLDLISPYRLEMGTRWAPNHHSKNLYAFWKEKLTTYLVSRLGDSEVVIDLASTEYSKVIDWKRINVPVITPVFKEFKGGKYTTVMMYAKHARGSMARYIIQEKIIHSEQLKSYAVDGYSFDDKLSSVKEWVFVR